MKCIEKSCPFPANEGEQHCRCHERLCALDISPSELCVSMTDDDISSAIYDGSVSISKGGLVPLDEWIENKNWLRKRAAAYANQRSQRNRAKGLCFCGKERVPGRKLCFDHYRRGIEQFQRRRKGGLCVGCGRRPREEGKIRCDSCLDAAHRSYAKNMTAQKRAARKVSAASLRASRIESGACADCGGRREDLAGLTCGGCRRKNNNALSRLRKTRLSAGLCSRCGRAKQNRALDNCRNCERKKRSKRIAERTAPRNTGLAPSRRTKAERYREIRKAGICAACESSPAVPGRAKCMSCLSRQRQQSKLRYQALCARKNRQ